MRRTHKGQTARAKQRAAMRENRHAKVQRQQAEESSKRIGRLYKLAALAEEAISKLVTPWDAGLDRMQGSPHYVCRDCGRTLSREFIKCQSDRIGEIAYGHIHTPECGITISRMLLAEMASLKADKPGPMTARIAEMEAEVAHLRNCMEFARTGCIG